VGVIVAPDSVIISRTHVSVKFDSEEILLGASGETTIGRLRVFLKRKYDVVLDALEAGRLLGI